MMYHPNEVARRARIASIVLMGIFVVLGGAYFKTQIINGRRFALQSEENRLRKVPIPAQRGNILDRNNQIIAEDVPGYSVSLWSKSRDSLQAMLVRLSALVPLPSKDIERLTKNFMVTAPTVIMSDATFEQVALLREHQVVDFAGLDIQATPKRSYPEGKRVAAFTGYMRELTDTESVQPRFENYRRDAQIGAMGLEEQYEDRLVGVDGMRYQEVNAANRIVRDEGVRPVLAPVQGNHLYTTIDLDLQRYIADSVFGNKWVGGVLVMNPVTGEVLALHSAPSYDPNDFIGGISYAKWDSLQTDSIRRPMYNKVTKGTYPPASTFKLAIAVLGLEAGVVSLDERMRTPCTGSLKVGNRQFHCWKAEGHGSVTLAEAIQGSCNVYFFQLGQRIGFSKLLAGGVDLGFAARSGIDLPAEEKSIYFANTSYYDKKYGATGWTAESETVNLAIGQGAATQTVANMARFYSALASDGFAARPQLIKGTAPERTKIFNLTPEQNLGIRQALASVVSRGTAAASQIQGLAVAGKTGTAENSYRGRKLLSHGWFVGFAPVDKPRLLVAILIEHGEHGSTAALEAKKIFARYFKDSTVRLGEIGG